MSKKTKRMHRKAKKKIVLEMKKDIRNLPKELKEIMIEVKKRPRK
jgi:hypothetical protein